MKTIDDEQIELNIKLTVNAQDLWEAVLGSGFYGCGPWWQSIEFLGDADYSVMGEVKVGVSNPDDEDKVLYKILSVRDFASALEKLMLNKQTHCGGYSVDNDIQNWDACCSDFITQVAIFGEIIYA